MLVCEISLELVHQDQSEQGEDKVTQVQLNYEIILEEDLVGAFDSIYAYAFTPELPPYQTGEGQFYENGEDMRYGYSKLSPDELKPSPNCIPQNTQDLFDII